MLDFSYNIKWEQHLVTRYFRAIWYLKYQLKMPGILSPFKCSIWKHSLSELCLGSLSCCSMNASPQRHKPEGGACL